MALLVGLLLLPRRGPWPTPLAWWIGAAMLPALVVGGALSAVDERLLEIPLTCLGMAWMVLGSTVTWGLASAGGRADAWTRASSREHLEGS
jgi:hypothetical protein